MKKTLTLFLFILFSTCAFSQELVTWSFESKKLDSGKLELTFKGTIPKPWYMYSSILINDGPAQTKIQLDTTSAAKLDGELKDVFDAKKKFDEAFGIDVLIFEESAQFSQIVTRTSGKAGVVSGIISYQICNGKECLMEEVPFTFKLEEDASISDGTAATISSDESDNSSGNESLLMFILIAFAAGIGSIITPCVFPMIPMTVSFFIGGNSNKRSGIIKGIVFGLSVTLIYTLIGILVSVFKSTDATDVMGTHWLPNVLFAVMFIVFAISFLGAFEITLPGSLANKADSKADKGGIIASFFVAFAMVIVSFSCTGPFVGSILAAGVTGGLAFKPVIGMFVFGFAFSLPFVIFSIFPSMMKKLPKSGSWLNVVKVIFAFILIAFALKYLSAADQYLGYGLISRTLFISIWIGIGILLTLYLIGLFKTKHDHGAEEGVGYFRILLAIFSLSFTIYISTGLAKNDLNGLSSLLPPKEITVAELPQNSPLEGTTISGLCGVAKYADAKHVPPYGLQAYYTISEAIECAKQQNKPVLLSFKSLTCSACKLMEANVWSKAEILAILKNEVVLANLYVDNETELPENEWITSTIDGKVKKTLGRVLRDYQLSRFGVASQPYYVLIDHSEKTLVKPVGERSEADFKKFLTDGIKKFKGE